MRKIVKCKKHGRVESPCMVCRVEKFMEKVKNGELELKPLVDGSGPAKDDITPLQIRFRASVVRKQRASKILNRDGRYVKPRVVRCFSLRQLTEGR